MIQIKIGFGGGKFMLEALGHAGYAEENDIVCAGVSAISYALYGFLLNSKEHVEKWYDVEDQVGKMRLLVKGDAYLIPAFHMAAIGFLQIEKEYPENVKVDLIKP